MPPKATSKAYRLPRQIRNTTVAAAVDCFGDPVVKPASNAAEVGPDISHAAQRRQSKTPLRKVTTSIAQEVRADAQATSRKRQANVSDKKAAAVEDGSKVRLTRDDYRLMVSWMERNFESIYGKSGSTSVTEGEAPITKLAAFGLMADHLYQRTKNPKLPHLKPENMQGRWRTYVSKFKATLKKSIHQTGMGISIREMEQGMTVQDKLEELCPHFELMKALIGHKPNVTASATVELGVPASSPQDRVPGEEVRLRATPVSDDEAGQQSVEEASNSDSEHSEDGRGNDDAWSYRGASDANSEASADSDDDATFDFLNDIYREIREDDAISLPDNEKVEPYRGEEVGSINPQANRLTSTKKRQSSVHQLKPPAKKSKASKSKVTATNTATSTKELDKSTADIAQPRPSAQESRLSLAHAYASNNAQKYDFYKLKLEQDHRHWKEQQEQQERARLEAAAQVRQAQKDRDTAFRQTLLLELVKQGKSPAEVEAYVRVLDEGNTQVV